MSVLSLLLVLVSIHCQLLLLCDCRLCIWYQFAMLYHCETSVLLGYCRHWCKLCFTSPVTLSTHMRESSSSCFHTSLLILYVYVNGDSQWIPLLILSLWRSSLQPTQALCRDLTHLSPLAAAPWPRHQATWSAPPQPAPLRVICPLLQAAGKLSNNTPAFWVSTLRHLNMTLRRLDSYLCKRTDFMGIMTQARIPVPNRNDWNLDLKEHY